MTPQVLDKLRKELNKKIENEPQVVYIMSRIRKLLEIKRISDKFPILNFYCNWALHSEISRTDGEKINATLKEFIEKTEERYKLGFHLQFNQELDKFLQEQSLPTLTDEQIVDFRFILGKIISDTPIKVVIGTKYRIIFKEPNSKDESGLHITTIEE